MNNKQIEKHIESKKATKEYYQKLWQDIIQLDESIGLLSKTYKELQAKISSKIAQCDISIQEHEKLLNYTEIPFIPRACEGVKCMINGCRNLAAHKVGEQNIWCNFDEEWNDEKQKYKEFNQKHELTTYLCEYHFTKLMNRETEYNTIEDNRYKNRPNINLD